MATTTRKIRLGPAAKALDAAKVGVHGAALELAQAKFQRAQAIRQAKEAGMTLRAIGARVDLTSGRVQQILDGD